MKELLVLPCSAGQHVVNVGQTAEQAADYLGKSGIYFRKGDNVLRFDQDNLKTVSAPMAQTILFEIMNVMKWAGKGDKATLVPATEIKEPIIKAILHGHYVVKCIPPITVVSTKSFIALVDGTLVELKQGYNKERNGVFVMKGGDIPDVPPEEAVESIIALFHDFLFATESDRSRAIASIFIAAFRIAGIFERHPLIAFEADDSQAGKGLLWSMICAIFGQKYGMIAQKRGGVGSFDEALMEKLVAGNGFILFDNVRGKIDSPYLEACLTSEDGTIEARVPGVRSIIVDPRPVVFGLTSNAAELTTDLANRTMMTRIRKRPPGYVFKTWYDSSGNESDIREHIQSKQNYYQGCVNAILKDWWGGGAKRNPCTEHSFKQTIGALDYIVQNYFKLPPILDGHQVALERTTKPGMTWLRQIALKAADYWHVTGWTAGKIAERCNADGFPIPGHSSEHGDSTAAQKIGILMASSFGTADHIMIDAVRIERSIDRDTEGHDRKIYTFRKITS